LSQGLIINRRSCRSGGMAGFPSCQFHSAILFCLWRLRGPLPGFRPDGTHPARKSTSPFNSTDLPLVGHPLPEHTISSLAYIGDVRPFINQGPAAPPICRSGMTGSWRVWKRKSIKETRTD